MNFKPIILDTDGVYSQLPDGGIVNAGGTSNLTFTVGGKGLLFDDGLSTSGNNNSITLQTVYNNSPATAGAVHIKLATGKDFIISDDTDDSLYFKIDSETGKVTITGDVEVLGASSVINTVIQDSDHWLISPKLGSTSALKIEPDLGVIPIVDLVSVRRTFGSLPVFRIDSSGNLISTQNLTVNGLINNVDIVQLKNNLNYHLSGDLGYRHLAADIDILPIATLPGALNVQQALNQINTKVDSGGGSSGTVSGYEHIQNTQSLTWLISHNKGTFRSQVTIYDTNWEQILPESVKVIDNNTILVSFVSSVAGRAIVILF